MTESKIETKIVSALEKLGCMVVRIEGRGVNGIPDLVVHWEGLTVYVEDKTRVGRLSAHQKRFREKAAKHGVTVLVARTPEEAIELVSQELGVASI